MSLDLVSPPASETDAIAPAPAPAPLPAVAAGPGPYAATGRRKTSTARVTLTAGDGKITVNGRAFEDYFPTIPLQNTVLKPLEVVNGVKVYDVVAKAAGGGVMGQAGAIRLGIARALLIADAGLRPRPQAGWPPDARLARQGAQQARPARRPQALPVLEALRERRSGSSGQFWPLFSFVE